MDQITIIGTGAMAMLMGGRLARAGIRVRFLGSWQAGIDAINRNGICLEEDGRSEKVPAEAYYDLRNLAGTQLALVLVKSWQTEKAAKQLSEILAKDGITLSLQNGLGNWEILKKALGPDRTAVGVTTYGATTLGPGLVRAGGEGIISIQSHQRLLPLVGFLEKAGFKLQQLPDISGLIWEKLIINVAINPLTGLLGVKNGALLESPSTREIMGMAAEEAADVALAQGIKIKLDEPALAAEKVANATRENFSSMLQDIRRGAPTEIDVLCAEVVRIGNELGLSTPVNELLTKLVRGKIDLIRNKE